jgi:hypothetical protein
MTQRLQNRLLFLSVTKKGKIVGYVTAPQSELFNEFKNYKIDDEYGVFQVININQKIDTKEELIKEFKRIHDLGWIISKRLDRTGQILPCRSSNCGGYTLEAELGITPNGYSEPDFLGWEIKQFHVSNFDKYQSSIITLMTPEPTGGFYVEKGIDTFIHKYGYKDLNGIPDRLNFGGVHKIDVTHNRTSLKMVLIGFDSISGKIKSSSGKIALIDGQEEEAASWSFVSLLKHWNRKHNQACYVPSKSIMQPERKYFYSDRLILGIRTDFQLFLKEMNNGNIVYDPGIKMENVSTKPKIKRRSQFRIKSGNIPNLYFNNEIVMI